MIWAITRGAIVAAYFIYVRMMNDTSGFPNIFGRWDTEYYLRLATDGYSYPEAGNAQAIWAFFPLYPMVCRGVCILTGWGIPVFYVGVAVSNACIIVASFFAVRIVQMTGLCRDGVYTGFFTRVTDGDSIIIWLLMFAPFTIYFAAAYTESLFVLCIVMSFYFMKKRYFLPAGIFAMFAGGVRNLGCLLIIPMIMEMVRCEIESGGGFFKGIARIFTKPIRLFSLLLTPVATFAYMLYLYRLTGDAWAFKNVQIAWRDEYHFPVVGVLWDYCTGKSEGRFTVMGWICVAAFALYLYMFIKGLRSEAVFGAVTLAVPLTSHVMSTPRFIAGSFVVWMGVCLLLHKMPRGMRVVVNVVLMAAEALVCMLWLSGAPEVM